MPLTTPLLDKLGPTASSIRAAPHSSSAPGRSGSTKEDPIVLSPDLPTVLLPSVDQPRQRTAVDLDSSHDSPQARLARANPANDDSSQDRNSTRSPIHPPATQPQGDCEGHGSTSATDTPVQAAAEPAATPASSSWPTTTTGSIPRWDSSDDAILLAAVGRSGSNRSQVEADFNATSSAPRTSKALSHRLLALFRQGKTMHQPSEISSQGGAPGHSALSSNVSTSRVPARVMKSNTWTDEELQVVRRGVAEGKSSGQICEAFEARFGAKTRSREAIQKWARNMAQAASAREHGECETGGERGASSSSRLEGDASTTGTFAPAAPGSCDAGRQAMSASFIRGCSPASSRQAAVAETFVHQATSSQAGLRVAGVRDSSTSATSAPAATASRSMPSSSQAKQRPALPLFAKQTSARKAMDERQPASSQQSAERPSSASARSSSTQAPSCASSEDSDDDSSDLTEEEEDEEYQTAQDDRATITQAPGRRIRQDLWSKEDDELLLTSISRHTQNRRIKWKLVASSFSKSCDRQRTLKALKHRRDNLDAMQREGLMANRPAANSASVSASTSTAGFHLPPKRKKMAFAPKRPWHEAEINVLRQSLARYTSRSIGSHASIYADYFAAFPSSRRTNGALRNQCRRLAGLGGSQIGEQGEGEEDEDAEDEDEVEDDNGDDNAEVEEESDNEADAMASGTRKRRRIGQVERVGEQLPPAESQSQAQTRHDLGSLGEDRDHNGASTYQDSTSPLLNTTTSSSHSSRTGQASSSLTPRVTSTAPSQQPHSPPLANPPGQALALSVTYEAMGIRVEGIFSGLEIMVFSPTSIRFTTTSQLGSVSATAASSFEDQPAFHVRSLEEGGVQAVRLPQGTSMTTSLVTGKRGRGDERARGSVVQTRVRGPDDFTVVLIS